MKKIKGVLFDKDGTLIDFYAIWLPVLAAAIERIMADIIVSDGGKELSGKEKENIKQELALKFGVDLKRGKIDPGGNLASATVKECGEAVVKYLLANNFAAGRPDGKLLERVIKIMEETGRSEHSRLKTTADIKKLFDKLKQREIYVGLATADSRESARAIMTELKLIKYFDFFGCGDDDRPAKPDPAVVEDFCRICDISVKEVAFVGDTPVDLKTGRNAGVGLNVGVLCGVGNRKVLQEYADILLKSPAELLEQLY